jgi:hypothetical protein
MGKPTFDNGTPRPSCLGYETPILRTAGKRFRISVIKRRYEPLNKIEGFKQTQGTETSQYLEERTSTETPLVVASERGPGQC